MDLKYDLRAEQITLGAMISSPGVIDAVVEEVAPRDFGRPAHEVIMLAVVSMHAQGTPPQPVALADYLARNPQLGAWGDAPYLHTLMEAVPVAANAVHYARIVRDWAVRRRIEEAGMRMAQRSGDRAADVSEILAGAEADLTVAVREAQADMTGLETADEFAARGSADAEPVIPGLLYAQERVLVVADEGAGKSTVARQAWVMTAAGIHMFTGQQIAPRRALLLDFENPAYILRKKIPPLLEAARTLGDYDPDRCRIWHRPGGVDLASPADQSHLTALVRRAKPDLIVAGPIYKMLRARGDRAESAHVALSQYLDQLRERFGVAVWLEHHAPMRQQGQRDMRPLDWGGWQRWPEFGLSLTFVDPRHPSAGLNVGRHRGDRDERPWPSVLERTRWGDPAWPWPWTAVWPAGLAPKPGDPW
jgi:replicative DNA helicase